MLMIENLSIQYKTKKEITPVIQNLSFQMQQGEALVILGPSGCGKSTLINALAGTISIQSGKIDFVNDNARQELNPKVHKIGLIPQNCGLLPWKTVKENCLLPLKIRGDKINEKQKEEMVQIFEALDISKLQHKYPGELSGGQLQRAAIARAFLQKPDLLLMDEPFSALDEITREEARELFLKVWKRIRPLTILVTHSIEEALYLGNRIFVMGKQLSNLENPYFGVSHPDTVDYLASKQRLRENLVTSDERKEAVEKDLKAI